MLKHTPTHTSYFAGEAKNAEEEDVPVWNDDIGTEISPTFKDQLSESQQKELRGLLHKFSDVHRNMPGRTTWRSIASRRQTFDRFDNRLIDYRTHTRKRFWSSLSGCRRRGLSSHQRASGHSPLYW